MIFALKVGKKKKKKAAVGKIPFQILSFYSMLVGRHYMNF